MASAGDQIVERTPAVVRGRVVVVGEAVVDRVRLANGTQRETPGGSPANVAIGLARLGHPTTFLTQLGTDADGDRMRSHLRDAGVEVAASPTPTGRTSSAMATLSADGSASYVFDLDFALPLSTGIDTVVGADALHLGSVSAILGSAWTRVRDLAAAARGQALVSYDVNIRPALTGVDDDVRRRVEALAGTADLVKASDEDLAALWPGDLPDHAARRLLRGGAKAVVVTLGSTGSAVLTQTGLSLTRPAVATTVVDTIGAGDSFMAGLIHALVGADVEALDSSGWATVLDRAARNAAYTVTHPGAAMPSPADVGEA